MGFEKGEHRGGQNDGGATTGVLSGRWGSQQGISNCQIRLGIASGQGGLEITSFMPLWMMIWAQPLQGSGLACLAR